MSVPDLHIFINGRRFPIYELDTIETVKMRLAVNSRYGPRNQRPIENTPSRLLPSLIILKETVERVLTGTVIAGCKAVSVRVNNIDRVHPLQARKFETIDFPTMIAETFNSKQSRSVEGQIELAERAIETFNIKDASTYAYYVVLFALGGIRGLEALERESPDIWIAFASAIEAMDIGSYELFKIGYEAQESNLVSAIEANVRAVEDNLNTFIEFDNNMNFGETRTSNIQFIKTRLSVSFDIPVDIYELFNNIELNQNIPFISVGEFFKVLKTFKPPREWAFQFDDMLVMHVLNKNIEPERNKSLPDPRNYSPVFITVVNVDADTMLTSVEMEIESKIDDELKEEQLLERIFNSIPYEIKNCEYQQKQVDADYIIPMPTDEDGNPDMLDIPLFYDMVMNDPLVSTLVIDESVRTFRERGGIFSYFRYNNRTAIEDYMAVRINVGQVEPKQQARDPDLFQESGVPYISVKLISIPSAAEAYRVRTIINKILEHFFEPGYKDEMLEDYRLLFPNINRLMAGYETRKKKLDMRRKMLKDYDPEMFVNLYQRFCTMEPSILETKQQVDEAKAKGQDTMTFPLYGEGVPKVFVCNHVTHPYVALKVNSLSNNEKFPILPCCASASQADNPNRLRWKYENPEDDEEEKEQENGKQRKIFISNKALKRLSYGILPPDIDKFLNVIDKKSFPVEPNKLSYIREGSIKGKNSVLDSIIRAVIGYYIDIDEEDDRTQYERSLIGRFPVLSELFEYETMSYDEKVKYLERIRVSMTGVVFSNVTAQSTYSTELKSVAKYLNSGTEYLDVCVFWRILEEMFHVTIILFQRNNLAPLGRLASPKFLQEYLHYKRTATQTKHRFTVMLYETNGAEFDMLKYPQVELVKQVRHSTIGEIDTVSIFTWFNNVKDRRLLSRFDECFGEVYAYDGHSNIPIPNIFESRPLAQCADFYGKIRMVQFPDNLCILTQPLPPMDSSEMIGGGDSKCKFIPTSVSTAKSFIELENILPENVRKAVVDDKVVGFECVKFVDDSEDGQYVQFYIPVEPYNLGSGEIDGGAVEEFVPPPGPTFISKNSAMEQYNIMSRLARYIMEYVTWVFSKWHKEQKGDIFSVEYMRKFAQEKFTVRENHLYPEIPRKFDYKLPGVMDDGRLIVSSTQIRNRLIYGLGINVSRNASSVVDYYKRVYIKEYYKDITDFELQDSFVLLFGVGMVNSWIKSKLPHYTLYDRIIHPPSKKELSRLDAVSVDEIEEKEEQEVLADRLNEIKLVIDPYFVKLENLPGELGSKIFIVQHASGIGNALYICKMWEQNGVNVGKGNEKLSILETFKLILYDGPYDYKVENINGFEGSYLVLQYRYEGEIVTVSLLPYM